MELTHDRTDIRSAKETHSRAKPIAGSKGINWVLIAIPSGTQEPLPPARYVRAKVETAVESDAVRLTASIQRSGVEGDVLDVYGEEIDQETIAIIEDF